ncbi:hypothetical protein DUNSADRAFT_9180 [Dunaliella salina]|uniref:Zinc transporter n=1 Tax=Dunaliella salina TaxID=3046 RepID=A0ABQ7GHZ9_DUNSA|nr:hypothetical protein DUNSADRAFT_9180 [Dunaliella salina]|eukprot:KAF5834227.1 hypothetical protein DUNSADRAFT_9180 [Dunaliella salina]
MAVREGDSADGELSQPLLPASSLSGGSRAVPGDHHLALRPAISSDCIPHEPCFLQGGEGTSAPQKQVQNKLLAALILCMIFMALELVGGYFAHSVAILADAAHMLSDAAGFAISLFAAWAVTWRGHSAYSFGFHRAEIIGALLSTLMIWGVTGALVWEAILRILNPEPVDGKLMFIVACAGILCNIAIGLVLGGHHHHGLASHSHDGGCGGHSHSYTHSHHSHSHSHSRHGHAHSHRTHPRTHTHAQNSNVSLGGHVHGGDARVCEDGLSHGHKSQEKGGLKTKEPAAAAAPAAATTTNVVAGGAAEAPGLGAAQGGGVAHTASGPTEGSAPAAGAGSVLEEGAGADEQEGASDGQPPKGKGRKRKGGQGAQGQQQAAASGVGAEASSGGAVAGECLGAGGRCDREVSAPREGVDEEALQQEGVGRSRHLSSAAEEDEGCSTKPHLHHGRDARHDHGHTCDGHGHKHMHGHDHEHGHDHGHDNGHGGHDHGHTCDGHGHDHGHSHENLNMRSALLHVLGDLLQSIGVALAGLLIWYKQDDPRWALADPICTFIFAALVLLTTQGIIKDIIHILMERTPVQHDLAEMYEAMVQIDGVHDVHDLHVWNLSMGLPILSAHVNVDADALADSVLKKLEQFSRKRGIRHSTVQICNPSGFQRPGSDDRV